MVGLAEERGSSSMVPEPRSWVQFPLPCHVFSSTVHNNSHLPYYLMSTHMAQACGHDSHVGRGMLDHIIKDPPPLSISHGFYGQTG
jgi:hypothetical protein